MHSSNSSQVLGWLEDIPLRDKSSYEYFYLTCALLLGRYIFIHNSMRNSFSPPQQNNAFTKYLGILMKFNLPATVDQLYRPSRIRIPCNDIGSKNVSSIIIPILSLQSEGQRIPYCNRGSRPALVQDHQANLRVQWTFLRQILDWDRASRSVDRIKSQTIVRL